MFKPTKKQHVVNKAYADKNGGSIFTLTRYPDGAEHYYKGSEVRYIVENTPIVAFHESPIKKEVMNLSLIYADGSAKYIKYSTSHDGYRTEFVFNPEDLSSFTIGNDDYALQANDTYRTGSPK